MTSAVHFRWKASAKFERVAFSGMAIRLFDLKKAIVEKAKLDSGLDLELDVRNVSNNERTWDCCQSLARAAASMGGHPESVHGQAPRERNNLSFA